MYWVYILGNYVKKDFCSVTINIEDRLEEHKQEMVKAGLDPEKLTVLYQEYYANAFAALNREKELKAYSSYKLRKFIDERTASSF